MLLRCIFRNVKPHHLNTSTRQLGALLRYNICICNRSKLRVERVKDFLVRLTRSFERFPLYCSYTMSYAVYGFAT